jgi:uncharacterized protein YbbC (DUF1343 family)
MDVVKTGLDVLLEDRARLEQLRSMRIGLLVNPTSVTRELVHAIDALRASGVAIERLFGPEHGVRGEAQDMEAVDEHVDPLTGIPTVSLYGDTFESLAPSDDDLSGLDIVLADIQDVGARYYTYIYTIGLTMQACGRAGIPVWVLDRPNPIDGVHVEGNIVQPDCVSFVGMQPIAVRHGMTTGEACHFFNRFGGWSCDLDVVELEGWRRDMWFDQTGLPWVIPSPNMPTLDTAIVYPGQCLLEGTQASEARGTTRPFEFFGAPWVDAYTLKEALDAHNLPGVVFRPISFRPKFQKCANETCAGLQIHVTDRAAYRNMETSYAILGEMLRLFPDAFAWREQAYEFVDDVPAIDLLLGDRSIRPRLEAGEDPVAVARDVDEQRGEFDQQRASCLIYS